MDDITIKDARIDGLYHMIKDKVDWDNLVPTCLTIASQLEHVTQLTGKEKLETLLSVLKFALKHTDKSNEEKEKILHHIDTVIPIVMQAAVLASKNPIAAQLVSFCGICWKKST